MQYKLLLLDIDGTLRPGSCERVPKENAEAVCAVQRAGVKVAIATGRGRIGVGKGLLRSIRPDYWVCAGGAQLVDYKGCDLALHRLTSEEMYALVDFFEDHELPLRFTFHDANYAYLGYEEFARRERELAGIDPADCVAVGDGDNDVAMLKAAGLGIAMGNGSAAAKAAADRIGPDAEQHGIAELCRALWPEAF